MTISRQRGNAPSPSRAGWGEGEGEGQGEGCVERDAPCDDPAMARWLRSKLSVDAPCAVPILRARFDCGGVAQLVRALPCHGRGYGFEPRHSRHFYWLFRTISTSAIRTSGGTRSGLALRTIACRQPEDRNGSRCEPAAGRDRARQSGCDHRRAPNGRAGDRIAGRPSVGAAPPTAIARWMRSCRATDDNDQVRSAGASGDVRSQNNRHRG